MSALSQSHEDLDFVEFSEDEKEDSEKASRVATKLYTYPADFTLELLKDKLNSGEIQVPPFQRNYVWTKQKASMLIDSFMRRLPVPPVYLFAQDDNTLLIVDGHQRLITIKRFFEDKWENAEGFKLTLDDKHPFNNKAFQDMGEADQKRFKNTTMRAMVVEPKEPQYSAAMYDIFQRLNTGGVLLMPQEIRNCVYHGKLNDTLNELNKSADWRRIVGEDKEDLRRRDVELVLRGIALSHIGRKVGDIDPWKYYPSMKEFLNDFMDHMQNPEEDWLSDLKSQFATTVRLILKTLGEQPFHLRKGKMNAPTYDAVFVAYSRHLESIPKNIKNRYDRLKDDMDFKLLTEDRPTGTGSVNGRIEMTERALFGS